MQRAKVFSKNLTTEESESIHIRHNLNYPLHFWRIEIKFKYALSENCSKQRKQSYKIVFKTIKL